MSIRVEHLTKIYGEQKAVDDISFSVEPGQVVGFLGPNGAGKSTTMKILTCFIAQTKGNAEVAGFDVASQPLEVRRRIGYLPEHNPLYKEMYVLEYLGFVSRIFRLGKKSRSRIREVVERTGLGPECSKTIGQLSKGYRQRVGLAQALLHEPEVLVLDEPTSGLDPLQLEEIRELIREVGREKTVLLSTHIMQEVQAICDRVLIIDKGKIVADDKTEHLRRGGQGQRLLAEFNRPVEPGLLRQLAGIEAVETVGQKEYRLRCALDAGDMREKLFEFAVAQGLALLKLTAEEQDLEDIFKQLTRNDGTKEPS